MRVCISNKLPCLSRTAGLGTILVVAGFATNITVCGSQKEKMFTERQQHGWVMGGASHPLYLSDESGVMC